MNHVRHVERAAPLHARAHTSVRMTMPRVPARLAWVWPYVVMANVVMTYVVMARMVWKCPPSAHGHLHSYGPSTYGLHAYGLHSCGLPHRCPQHIAIFVTPTDVFRLVRNEGHGTPV